MIDKAPRIAAMCLALVGLVHAQDPAPVQEMDLPTFISKVRLIGIPVTVTTKNGKTVNGLQPTDFRVYDNGRQMNINLDVTFHPVSIVVVVQANSDVEGILPKINKIGSLLESVVGESGDVALIAFDHRVRTLVPFTSDTTKITEAIKKIKPGSSQSFLNDTMLTAVQMLKNKPAERRRIILAFTETRDKGSSSRVREVLTESQFADVVIYTVDISRALAAWTRKTDPKPPRPSPVPAEAGHQGMVGGGAMTPTTQMQNSGYGTNAIPGFVEVFRQVKGVFVDNPVEVYTKWTGGREYSFATQLTLERAVADMGDEIRSQYLLTYPPPGDGGYHDIRVDVMGLGSDLQVRAKKGYFIGGAKAEDSK